MFMLNTALGILAGMFASMHLLLLIHPLGRMTAPWYITLPSAILLYAYMSSKLSTCYSGK